MCDTDPSIDDRPPSESCIRDYGAKYLGKIQAAIGDALEAWPWNDEPVDLIDIHDRLASLRVKVANEIREPEAAA